MNSSSVKYLVCEGGNNIKANHQMSMASIGVLIACMLLMGVAVLFTVNINSIMGFIENNNEAVVFVESGTSYSKVQSLGEKLKNDSNIFGCEFISKEDALKSQMLLMADAASLLEGLSGDENPLPDSYTIKIKDLSLIDQTIARVETMEGVDYVAAPTEVAKTLVDIKNGVMVGGLFIVTILGVVSIIIISNTIKVTIYNRRREINIMKYVGATDAFIRIPYLIEGMIIGIIASFFSFGFLWLGYDYSLTVLQENPTAWSLLITDYLIPFNQISVSMFIGFTTAGVMFGLLGSLFFVNKYLRV